MTKFFMLIGVPCSGKTTFREMSFPKTEYVHISSDDVIEKTATMLGMTYSELFEDLIGFAEKICKIKAEKAVKKSYPAVWDQTNLTAKSRAKKLALFPETYKKIAYVFPVPPENVLMERMGSIYRKEDKIIPASVMSRMISIFEYPVLEEGFSEIRNINV